MKKRKFSGPAIFMYSAIVLTVLVAAVFFLLYYTGICKSDAVLWIGIVSFMIFYHFGLRIFMGEMTKRLKINYAHPLYRERKFEKKLYKFLKVRKWKSKVLTFEPEKFGISKVSLEELSANMSKSELDHWINELISIFSLLFIFVWGTAPAFAITAAAAMLFDAQFIVVQRYNRPIVLRLIAKKNKTREGGENEI